MKNIFLIAIFTVFCLSVSAQQPINIKEMGREEILNLTYDQLLELSMEDLVYLTQKMGMSMDELLSMKLSVSSKSATTLREQPGIVSIYTAEDIERMGIRDFTDLLRLVPGYNINFDSQGVLGASSRGIWGLEGKILFLVDGIEANELVYACNHLGNRFPVEVIKRVEIIRGPGSSIYGGSAELGVVNIITKSGGDLKGIIADASASYMTKTYGHYGGSFQIGDKYKDFEWSLSSTHKNQNRSESYYEDFHGFTGYLKDTLANIRNTTINASAKFKGLQTRFVIDDYHTYALVGYDDSFREKFNAMSGEVKYDWKINQKFTLSPKLNYNRSIPWAFAGNENLGWAEQVMTRGKFNITGLYDLNQNINLVAGAEVFHDKSTNTDNSQYYNGNKELTYDNLAFFAQGIAKTKIVNIIAGARYEDHSFYGNAIAPRVGINKTINNFHFKLLYSKAFRSPSVGNITAADTIKVYNHDISIEKTDVAELELGYRIGKNNYITINFFDITIKEPITYYDYYEDSIYYKNQWFYNYNSWGYSNLGKTGSRGFEIDFQSKYRKFQNNLGYSFYSAKDKNNIATFAVDGYSSRLLGNPQHKFTYMGNFKILPKFSISPSIIFMSETNAYTTIDSLGEPVLNKIKPCMLANLMFRLENLPIRNMNIDFGVYDILDQRYPYIEPYNGYYPPFPGPSREIILKLRYIFKFKE